MSPKILVSLLLLLCWSCGFSAASRAETVAIWLFDESVDSQPGSWLQDSSGNGYHLELGEAQLVADGKFGGGLAYPEAVEKFAARRLGVQGTPLNLGNWDWTVEWWQRRDAPVMKGHVDWIYLTCDNVVQNVEKQEQWEFGFQSQSRFLGLGVWHHTRDWFSQPVRLNVLADKYDEVPRLALMHDVHPKFYAGVDPSFHHVAWVYDAGIKRLYYFEDGEGPFYVRDGTSVTPGNQIHAIYGMIGMGPLDEYPYEYDVYSETGDIALYLGGENMIGPNREMGVGINKIPKGYEFAPRSRQEQRARGVIDEMRVSRAVRYRESFSPPPSFSQRPLGPWLRLSTRRLDFISIKDRASPDSQTLTIHNVGHGSLAWSIRANQPWIRVTPDRGSVTGGEAVVVSVEVDSSGRWARLHEAELVLDTPGAASPPQTIKIGLSVQSSQESVWLFDEPIDAPHRYRLEDQSVNGLDLTLGPGGGMTPGKFGGGLDPLGGHQGQAAIRRYIDPTHLNLGHFDWTWECWIELMEPAEQKDVLFMARQDLRIGPTYPFYRGVGPACGLVVGADGQTLRFINERSGQDDVPLKTDAAVMQGRAGGWHHFVLSYRASTRQLSHWIDGQPQDIVTLKAPLRRFVPTGENNFSLGKTIGGTHALRGKFDELRISYGCRYEGPFTPPTSFAPASRPLQLAVGPHLLIDDHLIEKSEQLVRRTHHPEFPVDEPEGWEEFQKYVAWENMADAGPNCPDPRRRFIRTNFAMTQSHAAGVAGTTVHYGPTPTGPWVNAEENPVIPYRFEGESGHMHAVIDAHSIVFDPKTQQFVMTYKTNPLSGENPKLAWYRDERWNAANRALSGYRRLQGLATSKDGIRWENHQQLFTPDDWDYGETQFLWSMLLKRGDLYLLHTSIHHDDIDRTAGWTALSTSRDLYHWTRHRDMFIPYGENPKRGDKWFIAWGNQEIFIQDDYMYLAFRVQGSHKPPRRKFRGCARLPLDRFVSRGARRNLVGTLTTPLLHFAPGVEQLQLNADVHQGGQILVQLSDARGQVLEGYSFQDCVPVTGDSLRHPVRWRTVKRLPRAVHPEQPVRIEFSLQQAELFAFYLIGPEWQQDEDSLVRVDWPSPDHYSVYELLDITPPQHRPQTVSGPKLLVPEKLLRFKIVKDKGLAYAGHAPDKTLKIDITDRTIGWAIEENISWLDVSPTAGDCADGPAQVTVVAVGHAQRPGRFLGKIRVVAAGAVNSPVEIPVELEMIEAELP